MPPLLATAIARRPAEAQVALACFALIPLLVAIAACDQASSAGSFLKDGAEEIGAAHGEILCALHPDVCGDVYLCAAEADNDLGHVEICVQRDTPIEEVEDVFGACVPTPRHVGLCYWHCDPGPGCNAFSGCHCPEGDDEL